MKLTPKQFKAKLRTLLVEGCDKINLHLAYGKGIIPYVHVDEAVEIIIAILYPYPKNDGDREKA